MPLEGSHYYKDITSFLCLPKFTEICIIPLLKFFYAQEKNSTAECTIGLQFN